MRRESRRYISFGHFLSQNRKLDKPVASKRLDHDGLDRLLANAARKRWRLSRGPARLNEIRSSQAAKPGTNKERGKNVRPKPKPTGLAALKLDLLDIQIIGALAKEDNRP
jgi:hypothetical protein